MTTYRVTGGDAEVMEKYREVARKCGLALGASEEEAELKWVEAVINYGLEFNRPWLIRHPNGAVTVDRLTVASADLCGHLARQARATKPLSGPPVGHGGSDDSNTIM